jgi:hypothetical protein
MPNELESGVLYVAREFDIAIHLCPCGCGTKVKTPLGPTEWSLEEWGDWPTLRPSIGNWQQKCQSHYWITRGEVQWAPQWTSEQIASGRRYEEARRQEYYADRVSAGNSLVKRLWRWLKNKFVT